MASGLTDASGAPADFVLLHGFTHTGASWKAVIEALGDHCPAIAPDLRGHGLASARRPVSLSKVLDDLAALSPDRFGLAGYSMGGRIALHAALAWPQRITSLVLIGASPGLADAAERAERRAADEALASEIGRLTVAEFAERWAQTPVLAGQPPAVRTAAHADRLRSTPAGLAAALRGLGTGALPSLWHRLPELSVPVTLVVGERDPKFRAVADSMVVLMPRARVVVVPDVGHAVHLEAPEAVAELIGSAVEAGQHPPVARPAPEEPPVKQPDLLNHVVPNLEHSG